MAGFFRALSCVSLRCVTVIFLVVLGCTLAQKRARPAVADLEMLISDPAYGNSEVSGLSARGGGYDNLVNLAETLKKLQEMEKFYSHQARPRYVTPALVQRTNSIFVLLTGFINFEDSSIAQPSQKISKTI